MLRRTVLVEQVVHDGQALAQLDVAVDKIRNPAHTKRMTPREAMTASIKTCTYILLSYEVQKCWCMTELRI